MSNDQISRRPMLMNHYENYVFEALNQLPSTYRVASERRMIRLEGNLENGLRYEADFEVESGDGRRLLIEVKSEHSMSLSNMVRFVEIDKAIRKNPENGFLILVWGAQHPTSKFVTRPEFKHLHILHASNPSTVIQAIEKEFSALRRPA